MIFLSSFIGQKKVDQKIPRWSAAVYQPSGYNFPKAWCWEIKDKLGCWIRPRNFLNFARPELAYRDSLFGEYLSRERQIKDWLLETNKKNKDVVLCCWCPYDKAAQRQIKQFGSFICHLGVIARVLKKLKVPFEFVDYQEKRFNLWD